MSRQLQLVPNEPSHEPQREGSEGEMRATAEQALSHEQAELLHGMELSMQMLEDFANDWEAASKWTFMAEIKESHPALHKQIFKLLKEADETLGTLVRESEPNLAHAVKLLKAFLSTSISVKMNEYGITPDLKKEFWSFYDGKFNTVFAAAQKVDDYSQGASQAA